MKLALFLGMAVCLSAADPVLILRSDTECRVLIDGQVRGILRPGGKLEVILPPGGHQVQAIAGSGEANWRQSLEVTGTAGQELVIPLQTELARKRGFWADEVTGLIWATADNGVGVSWIQARRNCDALHTGGRPGWRLPSIDELQSLVAQSANTEGYRVRGPIRLTGWAWSSTPGNEAGEGWALDFGDGGRASVVAGDSGLNRALCVHDGASGIHPR